MSTHADDEPLNIPIDAAEVYRRASELKLPVYHGTRQSSAAALLRDGFQPTPIEDQIATVANAHSVPLDAVQAHLQRMRKFTHLDGRVGTVSTTADVDRAGSWANRAPEATHEASSSYLRIPVAQSM